MEDPSFVIGSCFCLSLYRAAGVSYTGLGIADAAARLVGADTIGKIIVVGAESAGAVGAHPGAASALADGEADTVILRVDLGESDGIALRV